MKDQFVIAYLADFSMTEAVVSHACQLARMLHKGLILLYVEDSRYKHLPTTAEAEQTLMQIEASHADLKPAHVALKGDTREVINALPTLLNGVVAVAGVNSHAHIGALTHPRRVLRNFSQCKIAYLTVQQPLAPNDAYTDVAYSIDFHKESKEKLIWASYFARFNHSQLLMLHYAYIQGRALFPETIVCDAAAKAHCSLLISVTTDTRSRDVVEWFAGAQEDRIVRNTHLLPILFINPRNDIYVLCD